MKLRHRDGSPSSRVAHWVISEGKYYLMTDNKGFLLIGTLEEVSQALQWGDPLGSTTFSKHDGITEFNRGGLTTSLVFSRADALRELEDLRRVVAA